MVGLSKSSSSPSVGSTYQLSVAAECHFNNPVSVFFYIFLRLAGCVFHALCCRQRLFLVFPLCDRGYTQYRAIKSRWRSKIPVAGVASYYLSGLTHC